MRHVWPVVRPVQIAQVGGCCAAAPGSVGAVLAPSMMSAYSYAYPYGYNYGGFPGPYGYSYYPMLYGPTDPAVIQAYRMGQRWM